MMRFDCLTLFPEILQSYMAQSMMKRAVEHGHIQFNTQQIRDFAVDEYGHVDDSLYGGGTGMLLRPEPLYASYQQVISHTPEFMASQRRVIFMSPKGRTLTQAIARELLQYKQLILICGHYEGVDQRFIDEVVDEELSIGDYVLTGGELAAMVTIDCVSRMIEGVLPDSTAYENDSHYNGLLEARQYTRPSVWRGREVPSVLRSGNHKAMSWHQHIDSLNETLLKRPELLEHYPLSAEELDALKAFRKENL